jgi:hypothetical protein
MERNNKDKYKDFQKKKKETNPGIQLVRYPWFVPYPYIKLTLYCVIL